MTKNGDNGTQRRKKTKSANCSSTHKTHRAKGKPRSALKAHHEYPSLIVISIAISKKKSRMRLGPYIAASMHQDGFRDFQSRLDRNRRLQRASDDTCGTLHCKPGAHESLNISSEKKRVWFGLHDASKHQSGFNASPSRLDRTSRLQRASDDTCDSKYTTPHQVRVQQINQHNTCIARMRRATIRC